jgi:uncharacterized protein
MQSTLETDFEISSESTKINSQSLSLAQALKYIIAGIYFGAVLVKAEVISWFRIQEMFRFQSFHMYGVIGSAVVVGLTSVLMIKKFKLKSIEKEVIETKPKKFHKGVIIGGLLFGIGWAITGACPGPIFAQIGLGYWSSIILLLSAIAGTYTYGLLRSNLPH